MGQGTGCRVFKPLMPTIKLGGDTLNQGGFTAPCLHAARWGLTSLTELGQTQPCLCSSVSPQGCPWTGGDGTASLPMPRSLSFCRHPTALHAKMCSSSSASGVGDSRAPASLSSELDSGSFQSCSSAPSTSTSNKHVSQPCCPVYQGMLRPGTHVAARAQDHNPLHVALGLNLTMLNVQPPP